MTKRVCVNQKEFLLVYGGDLVLSGFNDLATGSHHVCSAFPLLDFVQDRISDRSPRFLPIKTSCMEYITVVIKSSIRREGVLKCQSFIEEKSFL